MNCCEAEGFRLGRFHPKLEIEERVLESWLSRDVARLDPCNECSLALICGGGCGRMVASAGGDLRNDVICPPMANREGLEVLMDYYLPVILDRIRSCH